MKKIIKNSMLGVAAALMAGGLAHAMDDRSMSPDGAEAYIIAPENGATLSNPVTIQFGLRGMGIAPAGVQQTDTGHHHLLINMPLDQVNMADPIPADDNHVHFGGGQTEVTLDLPAGTHTLQLLLGDHDHIPHEPVVASEVITVTVE